MDSAIINKKNNKTLMKLKELLQKRLGGAQSREVEHFADQFFTYAPEDEIALRPMEAIYGATLSSWSFLNRFSVNQAKIQVFNPDLEQHGWHSNHTVIQILAVDSPFIVDSVRMELNRQGIGIHVIQNIVLWVHREGGDFNGLAAPGEGTAESYIYLEVDRHTEAELLKGLQAELMISMAAVSVSVQDFLPMKALAADCAASLAAVGYEQEKDFTEWLLDDHFTFLACDQVEFHHDVAKVKKRLCIRCADIIKPGTSG